MVYHPPGNAVQQMPPQQQHPMIIGQGMPPQAIGAAMAGIYPYSSPHMYDQYGRMKWGRVTWEPVQSEGPYRPFYTTRGKHSTVIEMVESCTTEELKVEIERERKTLTWHVFLCCCICALTGLKKTAKASKDIEAGRDTAARDTLLDAKIEKTKSCCWAIFNRSFFFGTLHILTWPFVWIPLLILKCGKK